MGEGKKSNFSCLLVLGLFRVVRLLFDFVLWLFRDGLVFFSSLCLYLGRTFLVLILFRLWLDEKTPSFSFSSSAKVEIRTNCKQKHLVKLIFSAKTEISGKKISRAEEEKHPEKVVFAQKRPNWAKKGGLGVKMIGRDEAKNRALLPNFAML